MALRDLERMRTDHYPAPGNTPSSR
jgi:hypothetical protein